MSINLKRTSVIFVVLLIIILLITFYLKNKKSAQFSGNINKPSPSPSLLQTDLPKGNNVRCTADVKQCPNGSYVGRVAPSCSFAPCLRDSKY